MGAVERCFFKRLSFFNEDANLPKKMVNELQFVCDELSAYLAQQAQTKNLGIKTVVKLDNVADYDILNDTSPNALIVTMVKWNEDSFSRQTAGYLRTEQPNQQSTPLQLFVLFTASYNDYYIALQVLQHVIKFFQQHAVLTLTSSNETTRLSIENVALNFEEISFLWSSLGGRQQPFALYKVKLSQ